MSLSEAEINKLLEEQKRSTQMLLRRDFELSRANAKLQDLDKEKSEFVSIAAHQLRTPLSAISWAQQMLLDGDVGELNGEQQKLLLQAAESIKRMIHLVNDLLNVDHLEFGQVTYQKENANVIFLLKEVVDEFMPMAIERHIHLMFQPDQPTCPVFVDAEKMKEAISNLLSNSLKYTLYGGQILIRVSVKNDQVLISINDNGIGIPDGSEAKLFKKFSRAENAKKVDAEGSGLGLFIVKKIVEAHEGSISYTSQEGAGTTFTLQLPCVTH